MSFATESGKFRQELDAHYAAYPTDQGAVEADLHALSARHPEWSPFERKAAGYRLIASRCPVKVFRHFPFYCELDVGKPRTDLGSGGVGGWLRQEPFGRELQAQGSAWWHPCGEYGLSYGWPVMDDNHLCLGLDAVLRHGLNGLRRQAAERLDTAETPHQRSFLEASIAGLDALAALALRFGAEAARLAREEPDSAIRLRLQRIAETAPRVPAEPPATFYEALATVLFMRELTQDLEGSGISILGHLDRVLWPFYRQDEAQGRLTSEHAKDLLTFALAFSDTRFGLRAAGSHVGTNTTVGIGGCEADGTPIFNDVTRMIVEIYRERRVVDPKLNARLSAAHPPEYRRLLAGLTAAGGNSLAVFNDDVVIPANAKMGKALADCRLYVGGGCQENILENTESNSRATMYLNLAQVLLMGFDPARWTWFRERDGVALAAYAAEGGFEALYAAFLANLRAVVGAHVAQRNRTEAEGGRYNPGPLHSATMRDCLEKAQDWTEGGARYNFGSVSLTGIGTLIDSLHAIFDLVYTRRRCTLAQLQAALEGDFADAAALRAELCRAPKYGQADAGVRAFAARVFADAARAASGFPNARGGRYEASLFSFRSFIDFGKLTGATPDGRRAGEPLSAGMSPSGLALGRRCSVGQVLEAVDPLDLTDYPVVAVLDLTIPMTPNGLRPEILESVLARFLAVRGSVLQMNTVSPDQLREARAHPERHPDLVVRVSGYSAYYTTLPAAVQDEVLARTVTQT